MQHRITYPLQADRWLSYPGQMEDQKDSGRCLGIRCNIWARAQRRREITHDFRGGGKNLLGWGALRWQEMVSTDETRFGKHPVLRFLPKKVANFLHEYHAEWFPSLNLPMLPSDRSRIDVHAMLSPTAILLLLGRLEVD